MCFFSKETYENQDFYVYMCTLLATNISRKTVRYVLKMMICPNTSRFFWGYVCTTRSLQGSRSFRNPFRDHLPPAARSPDGVGVKLCQDVTQLLAAHTMWKTFSFEKVGCFTKNDCKMGPGSSCKWSYGAPINGLINGVMIMNEMTTSRWWQLKYFLCSPRKFGEDEPILTI